jgi:hypothetical protein
MLTREVLLEQLRRDAFEPGSELKGAVRARRHRLEGDRVLDRTLDLGTPDERSVRGDERSRQLERIEPAFANASTITAPVRSS